MSSTKTVHKDWTTTFLLAFCLPGLERFYLGCPMSGILKCITCGGCGFWYWVDLFRLVGGSALCSNLHGRLQYINGPPSTQQVSSNSNVAKGGGNNNGTNNSDAKNDYFYMIFCCLLGLIVFYYILLPMFQTPIETVYEEESELNNNGN
jgi:TM2 domain-containing membrane protein YozV